MFMIYSSIPPNTELNINFRIFLSGKKNSFPNIPIITKHARKTAITFVSNDYILQKYFILYKYAMA